MYEMLAGLPPFSGEPIVVIGKQVTAPAPPLPKDVREAVPELGPILDKLLAKEPQNRFDDAKQLRAALSPPSSVPRISLDVPAAKTPPAPPANAKTLDPVPPRPKISRKHVMIGGGALVGVIGIVAIAMAIGSGDSAKAATVPSASVAASASASVAAAKAPPSTLSPLASASADVDVDGDPEEASSASRPKAGTATAPKKGSSKAQPRHTGPGGIYIPPPNTWFK
jgi:serine/threonine-protein kinase